MKWRCRARLLKDGSAILHTPPPTTLLHHWSCVLCNQLACSTVLRQLITWTVNSGQLCLQKYSPSPKKENPQCWESLSSTSQTGNVLNWTLRTKQRDPKPIFLLLREDMFWGKLGDTSQWHTHLTTVLLSLISFFSPPIGLQPEKGASNKE